MRRCAVADTLRHQKVASGPPAEELLCLEKPTEQFSHDDAENIFEPLGWRRRRKRQNMEAPWNQKKPLGIERGSKSPSIRLRPGSSRSGGVPAQTDQPLKARLHWPRACPPGYVRAHLRLLGF